MSPTGPHPNFLQISPLAFIRRRVREHLRVRLLAPGLAPLPVNRRPPVLVLRQALLLDRVPVAQDAAPTLVAVLEGLADVLEERDVPLPADGRVEDLVSPVEVLDGRHERDPGPDAQLPLVSLAG